GLAARPIRALLCGIQNRSPGGHIVRVRIRPVTTQIGLSIREPWRRSCGRELRASPAATTPTAAAPTTLCGRCCAASGTATLRTGGGAAPLPCRGLNRQNHVFEDKCGKNDCQGND